MMKLKKAKERIKYKKRKIEKVCDECSKVL